MTRSALAPPTAGGSRTLQITIVGDYDAAFAPHSATDVALAHAAAGLDLRVNSRWLATRDAAALDASALGPALGDAVIVAPGSPYRSMAGALRAIRHARESGTPLLGTCGGFQHVVIEYARHVLGVVDAQHAEYDPYASRLFVTPLSCSLVGRSMLVRLAAASAAAAAYGALETVERYYCDFGLAPAREAELEAAGLRVSGRDLDGEARVIELPAHPFVVATLFVPQLTSTPHRPHPLLRAFLAAAAGGSPTAATTSNGASGDRAGE